MGLPLSIFTNQIVVCSNHAAEIIGGNQSDEETRNNICLVSDEHFVMTHKLNFNLRHRDDQLLMSQAVSSQGRNKTGPERVAAIKPI